MSRHPVYLEMLGSPRWDHRAEASEHHRLWWLIVILTVVSVFVIGVRVTSGLL